MHLSMLSRRGEGGGGRTIIGDLMIRVFPRVGLFLINNSPRLRTFDNLLLYVGTLGDIWTFLMKRLGHQISGHEAVSWRNYKR
jgi:hypothetical protein